MRDFFLKIFRDGEVTIDITLFSIWHILWIILIVGLTIGGAFLLKNKSEKTKNTVLSVLAWLAVGIYIADFFIMPFSRESGEIDIDKLPFHFCTLMGCLIPFAQFNKKFEKIKDVIACISIVGSLMYITYPGSALGGYTPWCYKIVQTFVFHGLVMAWGVLSITTGSTKLEWKKIWKEAVAILIIFVWASLGNTIYSSDAHHYDWCFITGSTFSFVPSWVVPIAVFFAVFGMCAIIHLIDYIVKIIIKKQKDKKQIASSSEQ